MTSTAPYYNQPQDHNFPKSKPDNHHADLARVEMYNRTTNGNSRRAHTSVPTIQQAQHQQPIDVNLLQAVTSAAGKASALEQPDGTTAEHHPPRKTTMTRQSKIAEEAVSLLSPNMGKGKRKRESESQQQSWKGQENQVEFTNYGVSENTPRSWKRRRRDDNGRSKSPEESPRVMSTPIHVAEETDTRFFVNEYPPALSMSDARAAGVYSAAALFRKPTSASKKYTRPPMAKLFTSLELTPENFLRLQASTKCYMLDAAHPERRSCVGNRGKSDSDMVKLKLYHCVEEFLDSDGIGDIYFGPNSEGVSRRKWTWPGDLNKVISMVTPLCRRMVTNERQRQYAIESRKGGAKEKNGREESDSVQSDAGAEPSFRSLRKAKQHSRTAEQLDPALTNGTPNGQHTRALSPDPHQYLRFNFIRADTRRLAARSFTYAADACEDYATLVGLVEGEVRLLNQEDETGAEDSTSPGQVDGPNGISRSGNPRDELPGKIQISVFLPSRGVVPVRSEGEWSKSLDEARRCVWLEGELRVIVNVG